MRIEQVSGFITQKLETMIEAADPSLIISKRKAICTVLPYAIFLERDGQQGMFNAILCAAKASNSLEFIWDHIKPCISLQFNKPGHPSLDWVITLISPYASWGSNMYNEDTVGRWAVAASAVPYSEEVCQSVIDTLLQIAFIDPLRPHIPLDIWVWLTKQPPLPPVCWGRSWGTTPNVVSYIRGLGNLEILKSYFLLVWSEWSQALPTGLAEMKVSIREDFSGIEMSHHRRDLIQRLDNVLGQLDQELEYFKRYNRWMSDNEIQSRKEIYRQLKEVLLDVNKRAFTGVFLKLANFDKYTNHKYAQNAT